MSRLLNMKIAVCTCCQLLQWANIPLGSRNIQNPSKPVIASIYITRSCRPLQSVKISSRTFNPPRTKRLWSSSSPTKWRWKLGYFPGWIHSYPAFQILAIQTKANWKFKIRNVHHLFGVPTFWTFDEKKLWRQEASIPTSFFFFLPK